jgi:hypothetical protein
MWNKCKGDRPVALTENHQAYTLAILQDSSVGAKDPEDESHKGLVHTDLRPSINSNELTIV